jgi:hypothetical protein
MSKFNLRRGDVVHVRGVVTGYDYDPKVRVCHRVEEYASFLDIVKVEKACFQVDDEVLVGANDYGRALGAGSGGWRGVILWMDGTDALVRPTEAMHNGKPSIVDVSRLTRAPEIETAEIVPLVQPPSREAAE